MDNDQFIDVNIDTARFIEALSKVTCARQRRSSASSPSIKKLCEYSYMDLQYTQDIEQDKANVVKVTSLSSTVVEHPPLLMYAVRKEKMPFSMFPSVTTLHDKRRVTRASFHLQSSPHRVTLHFEDYENSMGYRVCRIYFTISMNARAIEAAVYEDIARTIITTITIAGLDI